MLDLYVYAGSRLGGKLGIAKYKNDGISLARFFNLKTKHHAWLTQDALETMLKAKQSAKKDGYPDPWPRYRDVALAYSDIQKNILPPTNEK